MNLQEARISRYFHRQQIKAYGAKLRSCEHHANHAATFRNHEDHYVNKHVGQGVRGCALEFLLNS